MYDKESGLGHWKAEVQEGTAKMKVLQNIYPEII